MLESMDKGKAQNKSPTIEKWLEEESQRLIKTQQMPKVNPKEKSSVMSFGVSMIKPL